MFGSVGHVSSQRQIAAGPVQPVMARRGGGLTGRAVVGRRPVAGTWGLGLRAAAVTGLVVLSALVMSGSAQADTVVRAGSFIVTTTGDPTASITDGGAILPTGVSFVDHVDRTATPVPVTVTASACRSTTTRCRSTPASRRSPR
jgi:hypothetical protein